MKEAKPYYDPDMAFVERIESVPPMLEVMCRVTGMRFSALAKVTEDRWIACNVRDEVAFGLKAGEELKIETTICTEIRQSRKPVIFNNADLDVVYSKHHTPALYGFKSYISMPIVLPDGRFFGTICALDVEPRAVDKTEIVAMFTLFADLMAFHISSIEQLDNARSQLENELKSGELRDQFIAILGHDLRNPLGAISSGAQILQHLSPDPQGQKIIRMIQDCCYRMTGLIENILDFARGRLGDGLALNVSVDKPVEQTLNQVIAELSSISPDRKIEKYFALEHPVACDHARIAQMFSNILGNAISYGDPQKPIKVTAVSTKGSFVLTVANAGAKIPPEKMSRLFQPFSRGGKKDNQGLGLGLYIASEIARAHGGELSAGSTDLETLFTFKMPIAPVSRDFKVLP